MDRQEIVKVAGAYRQLAEASLKGIIPNPYSGLTVYAWLVMDMRAIIFFDPCFKNRTSPLWSSDQRAGVNLKNAMRQILTYY